MSDVVERLAVPDPATTHWVPVGPSAAGAPGKDGVGVPQPVYNGMWIKGVGGVPVWAGITQPDLPANLGPQPLSITDWNAALATGWYMGSSVANAPDGNWYIGQVYEHNPSWFTQILYGFTQGYSACPIWRRNMYNGAWSPWSCDNTGPQLVAKVNGDGSMYQSFGGGGVGSGRWPGQPTGIYQVWWNRSLANPYAIVSGTDIWAICAVVQNQTSVQVQSGRSGQTYADQGFTLAVFEGTTIF
jgi:hypothetical protein